MSLTKRSAVRVAEDKASETLVAGSLMKVHDRWNGLRGLRRSRLFGGSRP